MHRLEPGQGGLERLVIDTPLAHAHIYRRGAQVTHFQPRDAAEPVLWLSSRSHFAPDKAIRGGVPICFPWFGAKGDDPTAPSHGLVRTGDWELVSVDELDNGGVRASFDIEVGTFLVTHTVTVGRALVMRLSVYHRGKEPVRFEAALHTYLNVGDVRRARITGLEGARFMDKVSGIASTVETAPDTLTGETDRVYLDTEATVRVHDPVLGRVVTIDKAGSRSTVVWNPWAEKAKKMADFGDEEWTRMLCVETANVADNAVMLSPGGSHVMTATISVAH